MTDIHEGGCQCGGVRYRTTGTPRRISACCCRACQLRTGAPIGVSVYLAEEDVTFVKGEMKTFERVSDAGRKVVHEFCPDCGTTVAWTGEFVKGLRGIAAGTFDEPSFWYTPERFVYVRTRPEWMRLDESIPTFEAMPA
jgi:hypothetical protein